MNSQKIRPKALSKSKQSINSNINKKKEKNKQVKSSKKKINIKTTTSDIKPKNINNISKTFKSQQIKNEEEKSIKQSQDIFNSKILTTDLDFSRNIISEKKVKNSISRLIDTSENLLEQQNSILLETDKLIQNIEVNEHEINKIQKKDIMPNFSGSINEYTENLDIVLSKLKKNTKDMEFSNKIKEENNNLKYRMQMLSIDKSDDFRNMETELNSIKTVYSNEMNGMLNYLNELGMDNLSIERFSPSNLTSDKIINFFNLLKRTIKQLKDDTIEKEEQIKMIKKYKDNNNELELKLFNKTGNKNIINNDFEKPNTLKSFSTLNNNIFSQNINQNILSNNNNSIFNNERIKKIEDLCLQHNYEDDNSIIINNKKTYEINNNGYDDNNKKSQSYMDNFQRSKNMVNNESNISGLGIQLEHNYTDSYFYQNMKDSYFKNNNNDNVNLDNINIDSKENISQINRDNKQ